jgi:ribose-phosphate pyrophosphokinase
VTENRFLQLQQRTADSSMMVFTGNSNRALAKNVAQFLNVPLGKASVEKFSDGEINVEILDNVRGKDVFYRATHLHANQ